MYANESLPNEGKHAKRTREGRKREDFDGGRRFGIIRLVGEHEMHAFFVHRQ